MIGWFRKFLAMTVALAFIASGAVAQPCAVAQAQQTSNETHHHQFDSQSAEHIHHHTDASKSQPAKAPASHDCMKCCGLCTLASLPSLTAEPVTAGLSSLAPMPVALAEFHDWRGGPEPGIPKSLA